MDINQQSYFLLREAEEFATRSSRLLWDENRKAIVLAQNQQLRLPQLEAAEALLIWENSIPLAVDRHNQQARIAASGLFIEYNSGRGFLPLVDGDLNVVDAPTGHFTDIAIGGDGRMAATYSNDADVHGVLVFHLGSRWQAAVPLPEKPLRVLVDSANKIWCFSSNTLMCCEGQPLPHVYQPSPSRFEPISINPNPLKLLWQGSFAVNENPLALTCDEERLAILVHDGSGGQKLLFRSPKLTLSTWQSYAIDDDCPFAVDLRFLSKVRVALLAPKEPLDSEFEKRDCAVVQLRLNSENDEAETDGNALLVFERYPMLSQAQARFVSSADRQIRYQSKVETDSEQALAGFDVYPRQLQALRRPHYVNAAVATLNTSLDSGLPDTIWHRIYLEGCIPAGCRIIIYAKVYNNPDARSTTAFIQQPDWVWCQHRSEQAFGKGLVESKVGQSGLFELLLQRQAGPVRRMSGRYLQIRLQLESNGRTTPAVHALKIYYPRFSYQEAYLPEHFRQEMSVDPGLDHLAANGADIRERMLAAFEGVLTPVETQIANAEILLNPEHSPQQNLSWLGELFGQAVPPHWPVQRQRRWLATNGEMQRCRGTLAGLNLALDVVTDGAVHRGQVVVVENFRLRRTMATILGLNMDDEDHPLTLGTGMSGNSLVGDSLILSDENSREFLALFADDLSSEAEAEEVEAFFDKYANRVSVLLHGPARKQKSQVEEILTQQLPAHLQWQIIESDHPFVLGLSPLLGVDTYVQNQPITRPVILDDTYLGREGVLTNPVAFSPRDINSNMV